MGQLVMSFRGLCIHVTEASFLPEGVQHRVVAVDANNGFRSQRQGLDLPAHHCYLEVSSDISAALQHAGLSFDPTLGSAGGMPFDGYRLTVVNATASQGLNVDLDVHSVVDLPLKTVPSLKKFVPNMALLPSITTETGAPSQADCYVDINLGIITASLFPITTNPISGGGLYTTWTVQTDGDPKLQLMTRDGKTLLVEETAGVPLSTPPGLTLSDDVQGSIVLHNSTTDMSDKAHDFALYYLAGTGGIPDPLPQNLPGEGSPFAMVDTTPSCSNSRYP